MYLVKGQSINEIQLELYNLISRNGDIVRVRDILTKEIFPVSIKLTNPLNRVTTINEREWNLPFAIGEMAWHLSGSNDFEFIKYYSKNWKLVLEDGHDFIRESCYGHQIFSGKNNLWKRLIFELKEDQSSRRAVLNLYDARTSLGLNKKDVACTSTIQFLIRNNKLDCVVTMRSNDMIWGLPNDIFFMTILQEWLSIELQVEIGAYYHTIGSLHVYERHFDRLEKIIQYGTYYNFTMPQMNDINNISDFLSLENKIRTEGQSNHNISGYWGELLDILLLRSNNVDPLTKKNIINYSTYKEVLVQSPSTYIFNDKATNH